MAGVVERTPLTRSELHQFQAKTGFHVAELSGLTSDYPLWCLVERVRNQHCRPPRSRLVLWARWSSGRGRHHARTSTAKVETGGVLVAVQDSGPGLELPSSRYRSRQSRAIERENRAVR